MYVAAFIALGIATLLAFIPYPRVRAWLVGTCFVVVSGFVAAAGLMALLGHSWGSTAGPLALLEWLSFGLDPFRGFFLIVTAVVFATAIPLVVHDVMTYTRRRAGAFLTLIALLYAAMLAFFAATSVVSFVFAWEIAALAIWALVTFDYRLKGPVAAGYLTLALSEVGTLAGMAGLFLLAAWSGSLQLHVLGKMGASLSAAPLWAPFLLTFFGFGVKAGIIPVNAWLPEAHGSAPRSVSPILSGATLNLGVFALWIIDGPIATSHPRMALLVLVVGAATALTGIIYALTEHDLKRLLAQSSIENLGIVVAALGAGFAFVALGHPLLGGIALVAGLYHMVNHSVYKTALFLGAGAIDRATGTHDLDRLGGLMHRMPLLATVFLLAALAIAALPPFGGFVSEWLLLESLLRVVQVAAVPVRVTFALSGAMLALTAGLALTCFVMVAGTALLGPARSREAREAGRGVRSASWPMLVLVVLSFGLGVLATGFIPLLGGLVKPLAGADPSAILVPTFFGTGAGLPAGLVGALDTIGAGVGRGLLPLRGLVVLHSGGMATPVVFAMSMGLAALVIGLLLALVWVLVHFGTRRRKVVWRRAWNGGLRVLRPEMNYTATGFAAPVRVLFDTLLRPTVNERDSRQGAFTTGVVYRMQMVNVSNRIFLWPVRHAAEAIAHRLARLHHGTVTLYAAWILAVLLAALVAVKLSL